MSRRIKIDMPKSLYDQIKVSARGRPVNKYVIDLIALGIHRDVAEKSETTAPPNSETVFRNLDPHVEKYIDVGIKNEISARLKDQTLVELETTERIAERSIKWAK